MLVLASPRSFRRLVVALVTVGLSVVFGLQAIPAHAVTGCEPTANVPPYNSFTKWAEASGTANCGGYYEISLVTSSGTTLAKQSGYYTSTLTLYTNWVTCPSGASVHSHVYEKASVQGNSYIFTADSGSFLCP